MKTRILYFICLLLLLTCAQAQTVAPAIHPGTPAQKASIADGYGRLPLVFEANQGQTDPQVKFVSRNAGYNLFLTTTEAVLTLHRATKQEPDSSIVKALPQEGKSAVLHMSLVGANAKAKVSGQDELPGKSNYFIGDDPKKWRTDVPTYAKVKYEGIYSGIDLVYYGNQRQLEYDFIVAPGADPRRIAFDVRGAKRIRRDEHGDLVLKLGEGEIRWHKPVVYQEKDGARHEIAARYAITNTNRVGFEVAKYDASRPLYIDPLIYSTYLGGSGDDWAYSIAVDSTGNAYVTGYTTSTDFPTMNPLQPAHGGYDVFVSKLNSAGSALFYSTYLGGSGDEWGQGIAVDTSGNAYVTGRTSSTDFPVTSGAFQTTCPGWCTPAAFVAEISLSGTALVYSTYLGGVNGGYGYGIAVDTSGNAYVTGHTFSIDFPVTPGAFQTVCGHLPNYGCSGDAFVSKINPSGSDLVYSTYLGGSTADFGIGIAVDSAGNAYVTGYTYSTDFPTMNPLQPALNSFTDAFVTKINPAGSALVYSTYLGGSSGDNGIGIAVDRAGNAYVTGYTISTNFPVTPGAFQTTCPGYCSPAFVTKINPAGSDLVYSTYLGGNGWAVSLGIAVDSSGKACVTGSTNSSDFPVTPGAFQTVCKISPQQCLQYGDAFVTRLNSSGSALIYSTYLGGGSYDVGNGIAVDNAGNGYITGYTFSTVFPRMNPLQPTSGGGYDAFVAKIDVRVTTTTALTSSPNPSTFRQAVAFTATVTSGPGAPPDGEAVTFKKGTTVLGTVALSGGSATFTTSALPSGTNTIKAVYGGDSTLATSASNVVKQVVNKATTMTTLASSPNPSSFGQSVTFTASVRPQFNGTVGGTVTFYDGTTALKTVGVSGGAGRFTTSTLALGTHSITAVYGGDSNFSGSTSAPVNQAVLVATTTTLLSSPNPSTYGQAVTFDATVTSSVGAPPPDGETISFMKGTTVLGTRTLSGGSASFMTSTLPVGTNSINAAYGGDSTLPGSTSKAVSQVVSKATTTATLASSQNPSNSGQSVTFTASVTPQFGGTVNGTVTFYDGTTALKTVYVSAAAAKFTTSTLASGTHSITTTYNGSGSFVGSSASLTQTVK